MKKQKKTKAVFSPQDREIITAVKQAICKLYEISEEELLTTDSTSFASLRFYGFWLLARNTTIKDNAIAEVFGKVRSTVYYGIGQVNSQKVIYRDTASQLKMIADVANDSTNKKHEWFLRVDNTAR